MKCKDRKLSVEASARRNQDLVSFLPSIHPTSISDTDLLNGKHLVYIHASEVDRGRISVV